MIGCGILQKEDLRKTTRPVLLLEDNVFNMAAGIQAHKS
jgi:hypothetical protein